MSNGLGEVVEAAKKAEIAERLSDKPLCDHCLGRLFGKVSTGLDNPSRGRAIRESLGLELGEKCWLCEGLFDEIEKFSDMIEEELENIEYDSFLVGSKIDPEIESREENLWVELDLHNFEITKAEMNREIGKILEPRTGKVVEFKRPDVVALMNTAFDDVELTINPIFVYGRYKKFVRDVPQTTWSCRSCWGVGCEKCDNTGKEYQHSVKDLIGEPFLVETDSEDYSFHGAGREDVDVKMLGRGRPFVLELSRPKKRTIDLEKMQKEVNRSEAIEVTDLKPSSRKEVAELKTARYFKSYKAIVELDQPVPEQKLKEVVSSFKGEEIAQQTPARVAKRRADKVRKRTIQDIEATLLDDGTAEICIKAEAGTYIKELVNGDEGRTKPSLAEMLGVGCRVRFLDVMDIHDEDGEDG
ncbi:MAG: tRNA pseudouridine(54/55) synthase Pus10 [Thermoplasmata archaeon]|nr:tRNA pseudouridine(54/55) synthase Pus10 [Thermoplasmata archaeon]